MSAVRTLMKVAPGSFNPPPKVWSALISIDLEENLDLAASPPWRRLLAAAFAQRRKKLANNLAAAGYGKDRIATILSSAGIDPMARAEELTASQWRALYQEFAAAEK